MEKTARITSRKNWTLTRKIPLLNETKRRPFFPIILLVAICQKVSWVQWSSLFMDMIQESLSTQEELWNPKAFWTRLTVEPELCADCIQAQQSCWSGSVVIFQVLATYFCGPCFCDYFAATCWHLHVVRHQKGKVRTCEAFVGRR